MDFITVLLLAIRVLLLKFLVDHGDLLVERSESSGGGGGGVAVDQHHIGLALLENVTHTCEHTGSDVIEVLSLHLCLLKHPLPALCLLNHPWPQC